jgi:hypothetical protein
MNADTLNVAIVIFGMGIMLMLAWKAQKRADSDRANYEVGQTPKSSEVRMSGAARAREEALMKRQGELEAFVQMLLDKLNESQRDLEGVRSALIKANQRINELEMLYEIVPPTSASRRAARQRMQRPLLVICGTDPEVAGYDLTVIDGIGIRYTRLLDATASEVSAEIHRSNGSYRWTLVSAHTTPEGVELKDGPAPNDFWMTQLSGMEVVGLATCRGEGIADHLADKVDFVWYFREGVETNAASLFVQKFFQRLNSGEGAENAFISCMDAVPSVAPFANYLLRRNK